MPFVNLEIIKPFISGAIFDGLGRGGNFDNYEDQAAIKIRELTGEEIPDSVDSRPDWVDNIAGWLIEFLAMSIVSGLSPEESKRIIGNYDRAVKEMRFYRKKSATNTNEYFNCGAYGGEDAW